MQKSLLLGIALFGIGLLCSGTATPTRAADADGTNGANAAIAAPLPTGDEGALIAYGRSLITDTRKYMPQNVGANMDCAACHLNAGTVAHGGSFAGIYAQFPQWNKRAKRFIALQDRLAECFLYSMNGKPPAYDSKEMIAMTAYIAFLSRGAPVGTGFAGQGFVKVTPDHPGDPAAGATIYAAKCASCHGANGAGSANFPPLWGPTSFNSGAGMNTKMASFVKANMPLGAGGTLSDQDATDVSAFVLSHPRPQFVPDRQIVFPPEESQFF
jgi:thiosulfate dehydrogenase